MPVGAKISMVAVLPTEDVPLSTVLNQLYKVDFTNIVDELNQNRDTYYEDVEVYLPKFKISSSFNLNVILHALGIKDAVNINNADLKGISPADLYVTRIIHKAEIEVDEDGTVASSSTIIDIGTKMQPSKFLANKPFAYFLFDKQTKSIVFAGKYSSPN